MPQLQTFKGTVFYDEQGSGEPLLLLHANPGDPRDFDAVLPALATKYRVIRLTWPGYGDAPPPLPPSAASAMMFAELLEQFGARAGTGAGLARGLHHAQPLHADVLQLQGQ